jgi:hypothetical protein
MEPLGECPGVDHGGDGTLHVDSGPAPEVTVVDLAGEGWVGPLSGITGVHMVEMAVEHDGRAVAPDDAADYVSGSV